MSLNEPSFYLVALFIPKLSSNKPFSCIFPISHRISGSSMQQSWEELVQVGGRSEENDGYEREHFKS